jgi:hypothetical protein
MTNVSVMGRVLGAIVLLSAAQAAAQDPVAPGRADCSTPRRAVWTWLANFQEDGMHPEQGVRCFDWEAVDIDDLDTRTQRGLWLKRVVDDRGLLFDPSAIPDSEALEEGEDRYAPFPNNLPQLYLVKSGSSWLFSAETIRAIPGLHDQLFDVEGYLDEAPPWLRDRILGVAIWKLLGLAVVLILALVLRQTITWLAQSQGARLVRRWSRRATERCFSARLSPSEPWRPPSSSSTPSPPSASAWASTASPCSASAWRRR